MTKTAFYLTAMLTISVALNAGETSKDLPQVDITVRLYDYVQLDPAIRERALSDAARILGGAGIRVKFLRCPLTKEEQDKNSSCGTPTGPADLFFRLLPPEMHIERTNGTHPLGSAMVTGDGKSRYASLFYRNVERLALERGTKSKYSAIHWAVSDQRYVALLLGHVLAHETGHLLLGKNSHTWSGLMRANWSPQDLALAIGGHLAFRQQEAVKMRREVRNRN